MNINDEAWFSPENQLFFRLNDYGYTILTVANMTHIRLQQLSIDKDEAIVDDFWISKDQGFAVKDKMRLSKDHHHFLPLINHINQFSQAIFSLYTLSITQHHFLLLT